MPSYQRRTWYGLSSSQRREVMQAVRRGNRHADPAVWLAAVEWAREEVRRPRWQVVVAPFLLDPTAWADRLTARRIKRVQDIG